MGGLMMFVGYENKVSINADVVVGGVNDVQNIDISYLLTDTVHRVTGSVKQGPKKGSLQIGFFGPNSVVLALEGASTNAAHLVLERDGLPHSFSFTFETRSDMAGFNMQLGSANGPWGIDYEIKAVIDLTSPDIAVQNSVPVNERVYQINEAVGTFGDDNTAFEDQPIPLQIAYAAQRFHNEPNYYAEQWQDFDIVESTTTDSFVRTAMAYNKNWIDFYQNPAYDSLRSKINASWGYYMNWLLGINDGASHWPAWGGGWNGTEAGFLSYSGWYVNRRTISTDSVVPHNVV